MRETESSIAKCLKKVANKYNCERCSYSTCKLSDWKKHLKTKKHNNAQIVHGNAQIVHEEKKKFPHVLFEPF